MLHIFWSLADEELLLARDLYLYNLIWILALAITIFAPLRINRVAISALALAILSWGVGSLIASLGQFFALNSTLLTLPDYLYLAFYPLLFVGLVHLIKSVSHSGQIETLDSLIFSLGIASLLIVLTYIYLFSDVKDLALSNFTIAYALADIALLVLTVLLLFQASWSAFSALLCLAITFFSVSDFYFIWMVLNNQYQFGASADIGWLIAIYLLSLAIYQREPLKSTSAIIPPTFVALSVFITPVLIIVSILRPEVIPFYLLVPSFANFLLAIIRMNTALLHSRTLRDERILARTDELTGLPNRRRLLHELDDASEFEGALLLMDLNQFKPLNDEYGHPFGDLVLQEVSKRFSRALPHGALLARLGGDEFGVMVRGSYEQTLECARALHASLSYPISISGREIKVGVSIGHVYNDGRGELLRRADIAMYKAKQMDMGVAQS